MKSSYSVLQDDFFHFMRNAGYETVESVEAWRGYIDIWLADLKYVSSSLSAELSSAPDYFAQARPAIEAMMIGLPAG